MRVAALFVDRLGPYPKIEGVDAWDVSRDARLYAGPLPIVAHPPCGPWSRLKHLYKGDEHSCAPLAVEHVRQWGGVLEHPRDSKLWPYCQLPKPGELLDAFGGFTLEIDQCAWGHVARKRTWLYVVGLERELVAAEIREGGSPTHWTSGSREPVGTRSKTGKPVPEGIKVCSATQRRRTPPALAAWLVSLAERARPRWSKQ